MIKMEGIEIPENVDVWGALSLDVKKDLLAIARLARIPVKRLMVESILTAGVLTDIDRPSEKDYGGEYEKAKNITDD